VCSEHPAAYCERARLPELARLHEVGGAWWYWSGLVAVDGGPSSGSSSASVRREAIPTGELGVVVGQGVAEATERSASLDGTVEPFGEMSVRHCGDDAGHVAVGRAGALEHDDEPSVGVLEVDRFIGGVEDLVDGVR
jgi:hypothetical protein